MSTERALLLALFAAPVLARDPGVLLLYPGHGTPDGVELVGRLLEDEGVGGRSLSRWGALRDNLKRLESDEIEHALVEVECGGATARARTDDDGLFRVRLAPKGLAPGARPWRVRVIEDRGHPTPPAQGVVHVFPHEGVALLSDFDDTIVHSHITSKKGMLRVALLKSAATTRPVAGAAAAYSGAVASGYSGVFYLSGSPQNFMPRIVDFLRLRGFPAGPVLLKNFGSDPTFDQVAYKLGRIRQVLAAHPRLVFTLVGDSGERDPEIYAQIRAEQPGRVAGIVIRRARGGDNRPERFHGMTVVDDFATPPAALLTPPRLQAPAE